MTYYLHVPSEWHFQEAAAILQRIPSSRLYFLSFAGRIVEFATCFVAAVCVEFVSHCPDCVADFA